LKPIDQDIFGNLKGNCFQAAVASILELPLEDVPHVMIHDDWDVRLHEWLSQFNLWTVAVDAKIAKEYNHIPAGYHLISGQSPRGDFWHTVVGYQGEMVHDPHPSRDGLTEEEVWRFFVPTLERGSFRLSVTCRSCGSDKIMAHTVTEMVCMNCGYARSV